MRKIFCFLALFFQPLWGFEGYLPSQKGDLPWFTGPLISSSGNNTQAGGVVIEPYLIAVARRAFFDSRGRSHAEETLWTLQLRSPLWVGLSKRLEFKIEGAGSWKHRSGAGHWVVNDPNVHLAIQLHRSEFGSADWFPSVRLILLEVLPLGKYQRLNVYKKGTDAGGMGAWTTLMQLCASKLFFLQGMHYLNLRINASYACSPPVSVEGLNAYGGGFGTQGRVHPGPSCRLNCAFEYSLNRSCALALDAVASFAGKTSFYGDPGTAFTSDANIDPAGLPAQNEQLASVQYSLAPALEYSWSPSFGMIVGSWFTVAGKNTPDFVSSMVALVGSF